MRGTTSCRLQKPTQTKTATLADTTTWGDVTTFYGSLQPVSAREGEIYARTGVVATHKLYALYRDVGKHKVAELKGKNRIVIADVNYDITGVDVWPGLGKHPHHYVIALKVVS